MRRCLTAVALVVAILLGGHPVSWAQQAPIVLKAGTAVGATSPLNDAMVVLDKALQEKSKGRLKMEIHINNSIAKGERAFCFGGGWGFRNMMSNKRPIVTPDDMKGQTIRVQESPTYITMMKSMGANPVPMPYVEVYLAMKQGTIDGMELPSFSLTADKFQEVTKYYSMTRHS